MKPDAVIAVRFLRPEEGGRNRPILGSCYGCPLMVHGEAFDCRFILEQSSILELGNEYEIPVKFRDADLALDNLAVGDAVTLWEGRIIAEGSVTEILG